MSILWRERSLDVMENGHNILWKKHPIQQYVKFDFPCSSVSKESACNAGDPGSSWVGKICWRRDRLPTPVFLGFPCGSAGKENACNARDLVSIPGLGRSPGEGKGYSLQYSGLENSMDYSPWGCRESWTGLSNFHFLTFTSVQKKKGSIIV